MRRFTAAALLIATAAVGLAAARLESQASASSAALQPLPRATALSWSPDGRRIAFVSKRGLWVADSASGRASRVATVVGLERPYLWQSRNTILYATATSLRRFSLLTRRSTVLARGDFRFDVRGCFNCSTAARGVFDLSRDRRSLVARRIRPWLVETFTVDLTTRRVRVIAGDGIEDEKFPRRHPWQPLFGPRNVISRIAIAGWTLPPYVIAIHERRRQWRIVPPYNAVSGPVWSPDASRLAYAAEARVAIPEDPVHVRLHHRDGRDTFVAAGSAPRWSPDGALLAIDHPWGPETVLADAEGRVVRELEGVAGFVWSAEGRSAFVRESTLHAAAADGTSPVPLAPAFHGFFVPPAWSPDSGRIAFVRTDDPGIWVLRPDGSGLRKLVPL